MHNFRKFLPFELEEGQLLSKALEKLETKQKLLFRSPPGSGKTAISLAYLLSKAQKGFRSVIFFRTKAEINQGLALLHAMVGKKADHPLFAPLVGKEECCLYPPSDSTKLQWWCAISQCGKRFQKWNPDIPSQIQRIDGNEITIDHYIATLQKMDVCPFYALRKLAKKVDILLTTYPYLTSQELFTLVDQRDYVFLDEAHSLLLLVTEEISKENLKHGKLLLEEAQEKGFRPEEYIVALLRGEETNKASVLADYLSFQTAEGDVYRTTKNVLKIMSPSQLLQDRFSTEKIMVMSSTLYPSSLYKKLFGINNLHLVKGMLKPGGNRLILGLTSGLTSKFEKRSDKMLEKYANTVNAIHKRVNVPTLIFAPSYSFAFSLSEHLGFPVTETVEEIPSHLKQYGKVLTVARGTLSEGVDINFEGAEPQLILVTGLPYPQLSEKFQTVAKAYSQDYNIPKAKMLRALNRSSMVSALVQMIGRTGRTKKGTALIMDDRIQYFDFKFPLFRSLPTAVRGIQHFLEPQQKG